MCHQTVSLVARHLEENGIPTVVVANAIIWAGVILASSLVMAGSEQPETVGLLLIVGWYASHLNLTTSPSDDEF